jgi:IS5 family transposase
MDTAQWRRRRGFLKIHIAVGVRTKQIVALEVTDERTGDGGMLKPLVELTEEHCRVVKAVADGAYDSKENFEYLTEKGIDPAIRVRKSSSHRTRARNDRHHRGNPRTSINE